MTIDSCTIIDIQHCFIDCLRSILNKIASYGMKHITVHSSSCASFRTKLLLSFLTHILLCFSDINECSSNPCRNGGTCRDGVNSYTCNCVAGYKGVHCQTSKSAPNENFHNVCCRHLQHRRICPCLQECVSLICDFVLVLKWIHCIVDMAFTLLAEPRNISHNQEIYLVRLLEVFPKWMKVNDCCKYNWLFVISWHHGRNFVWNTGKCPPQFFRLGGYNMPRPPLFLLRLYILRSSKDETDVCHVFCEVIFKLDVIHS